ncbi:serine/threonine protein kinase [Gimesia fumaroli]|uniref:Serine/threonine-protein kinase PknB n=1 Tax=Gimesia fumaroli TaxID=2527976 RepID=A0A518IAH8_9PLAN|nr:serine/threonine-protein kinase [Gimesia fumaroli]QDV50085.1 Serine/threonine-protein kinase PknB [Gimesia fumaroli]
MTDPQTGTVQRVFLQALDVPAEEREAWLQKKCGSDKKLLAEVRSLLEHAEPSADLLEQDLDQVIADIPRLGDEDTPESETAPEDDPPVDCDHFLSRLSQVGVLSPDEFASVSDSVSSNELSADPRQLASQLVTEGKLTSYQASALLKGEPELLIDKYLILDLIDVGGMGMVFKAIHRNMNRIVALKMISQQMLASEEQTRRFKREVRVAATLEHPNIVRAYDADEARGVNFLVMEYVRGDNLSRIVRTSGPLSLSQAVDCIRQAAFGLQHAHERGIVHRDIKPGNLLLDDQGTVKLLDLGLAHIDDSIRHNSLDGDSTANDSGHPFVSRSELTAAGAILGTASFMAPEQSLDAHLVDSRSDIYSLGCTLYYLLTGETPYSGNTIFKVFVQHREAEIPDLQEKRPDVPDSVAAVYRKMVAKDPDNRFQSMRELIVTLDDCHIAPPDWQTKTPPPKAPSAPDNSEPTSVEPGKVQPRTQMTPRTRAGLIVVACLVTLVGVFALFWTGDSLPNQNQAKDTNASLKESVVSANVKLSDPSQASAADLLASGDWEWKIEKNLGPVINSRKFDLGGDMTADERTIVFSSVRDASPPGNRDLWIATRPSREANWSAPERLPAEINTDSKEESPQISADGLRLLFHRGAQTLLSTRASLDAPWQEAVPDPIPVGNKGAYKLTPDGLTAFHPSIVSSWKGLSDHDDTLFVWRRKSLDAPFEFLSEDVLPAVGLTRDVGTMSNDGRLFIMTQHLESDSEKPQSRLVMFTRSGWNQPWSKPRLLLPENIHGGGRERLLNDGRTLLFVSGRPGGQGASDLWMARLVKKPR